VSDLSLFANPRVIGFENCPNSLAPSVGTISFLLQTNPTMMNIEDTPQGPPDKQGERVEPGTFVPETPHADKGKSTSFQTPLAGTTSQTPETQMQRMAKEIEALKRQNASLTRQLHSSPFELEHVEGEEFSEDDDDEEMSPDEEEYGGEEGLRMESYRGDDRQRGGSRLREEPVNHHRQEEHENVQANDQRPPEGPGGDRRQDTNDGHRADNRQRRRRFQGGPHPGGGAGRRLNFEGEGYRNPRAGYYQANPPPPEGDVHALIRSLEAKYDAVLRDMGGKPSTVDSIIQNAGSAFTARVS
jgi:hypothetical protein